LAPKQNKLKCSFRGAENLKGEGMKKKVFSSFETTKEV
jgi:hypothetical protein